MADHITATMATTPERIKHAAGVVVDLAHQVDELIIYVNGPRPQDEELPDGAEWLFAPDGDLADNGKFFRVPDYGWHFTVDDDLHYPHDYVQRTTDALDRYGRAVVACWHGSRVREKMRSYYREKQSFRCLEGVAKDTLVHVPGTGVMAYRAGAARFDYEKMPVPWMADIWAGIACQEQRVPVVCLAHESGWIRHREIDHTTTIFNRFHNRDEVQTWAVNRQRWYLFSPLPSDVAHA